MVRVTRNCGVDLSQVVTVATFATVTEARQYIAENTVDGVNLSNDIECDYLDIVDLDIVDAE